MQRKIYYWDSVIGDASLLNEYKEKIDLLLSGNYREANLDLKRLPGHRVYSIRLNLSDRLLFTTVKMNNVSCLVLLECIKNHDYQKSKFLRREVLNHFLETNTAALYQQFQKEFDEINGDRFIDQYSLDIENNINSKEVKWSPAFLYDNKFIELNVSQDEAVKAQLPAIVSGPAGSGKSCVGLKILEQSANTHSALDPRKILYVTGSPALLKHMEAMWSTSPVALSTQLNDTIHFKTYQQLLLESVECRGLELVGKESFDHWFKEYIGHAQRVAKTRTAHAPKFNPEFIRQADTIYQEFRIISGYSTLEAYLALGVKECLYHDGDHKTWLWHAYAAYVAYLSSMKRVHPAFTPFTNKHHYACIVVDEAQDFSQLQLKQLLAFADNRNICFCMDSHQSLADNKSKLPYLLTLLRDPKSVKHSLLIKLPYTYRCPQNIAHAANAFIEMKKILTGGAADKYEDHEILVSPTNGMGEVNWIDPRNVSSDSKKRFEELSESTEFAVVTLPGYEAEARRYFNTPLIFTPDSIKGLQYRSVVFYRILEFTLFTEANHLLQSLPSDTKVEKAHRRKRDRGDERFGPPCNWAIVSCTRAMSELTFMEEPRREVAHIIERLKKSTLSADRPVKSQPSVKTDWLAEAQKQLKEGNIHQAKDIYLNKLSKTEAEFSTFFPIEKSAVLPRVSSGCVPAAHNDEIVKSISKNHVNCESREIPPQVQYLEDLLCGNNFTTSNLIKLLKHKNALKFVFLIEMKNGRTFYQNLISEPSRYHIFARVCVEEPGCLDFITLESLNTTFNTRLGKPCRLLNPLVVDPGVTLLKAIVAQRDSLEGLKADTLCSTPTEGLFKGYSALFWLTTQSDSIVLLRDIFLKHNELAKNMTPAALFTPVNTKERFNRSAFYNLLLDMTGTLLLVYLFKRNPDLFKSINADILNRNTNRVANDQTKSLLFLLAYSADSRNLFVHILEQKPELAREISVIEMSRVYYNFKSDPTTAFYLNSFDNAGCYILHAALTANPEFATGITAATLGIVHTTAISQSQSAFYRLSRHQAGMAFLLKLIHQNQSIFTEMTYESLFYPGDNYSGTSVSPFANLITTEIGIAFLYRLFTQNPGLAKRTPASYLCSELFYQPGCSASVFKAMIMTEFGLVFLKHLLFLNPSIAKELPVDYLLSPMNIGVHTGESVFYCMINHPQGQDILLTILKANPHLFDTFPIFDLISSDGSGQDKADAPLMPLFSLALTHDGRLILHKIMEKSDIKIPFEHWEKCTATFSVDRLRQIKTIAQLINTIPERMMSELHNVLVSILNRRILASHHQGFFPAPIQLPLIQTTLDPSSASITKLKPG